MTATFVKPVHHMQTKAAAKNGLFVEIDPGVPSQYRAGVIDMPATVYGVDAGQVLLDANCYRMLRAEYPELKLRIDMKSLAWTIYKGGKALATANCLQDAWDLAAEELASKPAKKTKEKAPKAVKPAKKAKAPREDDADEEGAADETEGEEGAADETEGEEEGEASKSVVAAKYKTKYRPHKDTNGDGLGEQIRVHCTVETEEGKKVDFVRLRAFANANGCWQASYAELRNKSGSRNVGMMKMCVTNRLRAKIRHAKKDGKEYEIIWK